MKKLKLGIIGFSEGNGHPYSWSTIFNGYNKLAMEDCGFPVIPRYLEKQKFPEDTIKEAKVTHLWTQDSTLSHHIALATHIPNIVGNPEEMIGEVDGILLARDDSETHYELAAPFLDSGLPIYIDKPICLSIEQLERFYALEKFPGQIFTCSAVRYGHEFKISNDICAKIGKLSHIHATTPKSWEKYGIHVIEPLLTLAGDQGKLQRSQKWAEGNSVIINYKWESGFQATVSALGDAACPLSLRLIGNKGWYDIIFEDAFFAFRAALNDFVTGVIKKDVRTDPDFVRRVVEVIELGIK